MDRVLGHYDAVALERLFAEAGTLDAIGRKGFTDLEVTLDCTGRALPHVLLFGSKRGTRYQLLEAIVGETLIEPDYFAARGTTMARPVQLAVVHWLREEDPTTAFSSARPALPLQHHPGLGVLRSAFRVVLAMARDLGKDGIASTPKFFHDAAIFARSRLFLFLDGAEQGRFEALTRDLARFGIGDASLAMLKDDVRDAEGKPVRWAPSFQVFPLSGELTGYFHAPAYTSAVERAFAAHRFSLARSAPTESRTAH